MTSEQLPQPTPQPEAEPLTSASVQRVAALRKNNTEKSDDELVEALIRNRCLQVAGVGAATAGAAIIPSVGAIASVAVGSMVDMNSTHKIQTELVLDIATIYGYDFAKDERQEFLMLALGAKKAGEQTELNATEQLLVKGGQQLARKATQRVASKSAARVLPAVGVATSAGTNILMTYSAGQRAKAYVKTGPESVGEMELSIRSALGKNELTLSNWTRKSLADAAFEGIDQGAIKAGRAAGKATRKLGKFLRNVGKPR